MKLKKKYIGTLLGLFSAVSGYSQQDLIQQVPEEASFVVVVNNQAIVKHSSFEKINQVLDKAGLFKEINKETLQLESISDLDLSYDRNAYVYKTDTDSSYYIGILLPLKANHQIGQNLFGKLQPLPVSQGYERRVSTDGKTQVAWNKHSLLILTGDAHRYYFDNDSVAQRYGLEIPDYGYASPTTYDYDYVSPDTIDETYALADSVETTWDAYNFEEDTIPDGGHTVDSILIPPPVKIDTGYTDYLAYDTYSDSTYQNEMARNAKNDSLRNAAFVSWLAQDLDRYLYPNKNASSHRFLNKFDKKNTLVHVWVRDLVGFYKEAMPYYMSSMQLGYGMENLIYAYQDIVFDLVQDKHTLKITGSMALNEEMDKLVRPIYKNKMNRKFAKYIPENHIGYFSANFNMESYLKSFPIMMERWGGYSLYAYQDIAGIVATAFDVILDEKAIANVIGGDHLVFINELKKVKKEYIDYEYDNDSFDYKEIKKTKDDYIPTFLWMFTSKDQRIYQKILSLGESKEKVMQTNGIYKIVDTPKSEIIYVLFKNDIVFVSNDADQLSAIRTNKFRASKDRNIKKQIFSHNMTAVTHLSEIPKTINRLEIPVIKRWDNTVKNLSQYGDVTITAGAAKKGRITGEIAVDFPKKEANALQYLLQELLHIVD
ncbi:hypothetical protein [Sphingobacterium arenae]|uniref:DUF4836 domain-containing protein n=1 Tax=Sphingobacterium arenae TaxID=1280598 RepID=A0ABR7Y1X4_9SPHI|nr:hypothetical protein [Sphingobacterium arenae]MBD1425291.1 hypothetical protein [Sphingobacterium arenae]